MPNEQNITYRVNVDDANFQAKLSQMRASLDMTMGGYGLGAGGMMGGAGMLPAMGLMGSMMTNQTGMMMSGLADFGSQIRPVTYTPPAIAMQPHFGMIQLQQSLAQAGLSSFGPVGMVAQGVANFARGFSQGGISGAMSATQQDLIPRQITANEYAQLSSRAFAGRLGDAVAVGALTVGQTAASIAAGSIGYSAGASLASGGLAKFALGSIGGMAAAAPVMALGAEVAEMMTYNRAVQNQLEAGSFRFISGGPDLDPLTGRGFGRRARAEVATSIQDLELRDVRYGMDDMRQILESGMQLDMFSGTQSASEFKTKFKNLVDTMKTITSTLHTSMQEGMEVMRGFRDMGVTDPGQMIRMSMQSEMFGRMSGRTGMEMMALGQTGVEMFRGTGIRMGQGFDLMQQNVVNIRGMLNTGLISRELVAQMGGENAAAQQMTGNALASFQTAMGRGMMMAAFDPRTSSINFDQLSRSAAGGAMSLIQGAAGMAANPMDLIKLQAFQEEAIGKLAPVQMQMFGALQGAAEATTLLQQFGRNKVGTEAYREDFEAAFVASRRRQGTSLEAAKMELAMMNMDPDTLKREQQVATAGMMKNAMWEDFRNQYGFKAVGNAIRRTFVQPVQEALTGISTSIGMAVEEATMNIMGGYTTKAVGATEEGVKAGAALLEKGVTAPWLKGLPETLQTIAGRRVTAADEERAAKFKLGAEDFKNLRFFIAEREGTSEAVSAEQVGQFIFGDKFTMDKASGYQRAVITRQAEALGASKAAETLKAESDPNLLKAAFKTIDQARQAGNTARSQALEQLFGGSRNDPGNPLGGRQEDPQFRDIKSKITDTELIAINKLVSMDAKSEGYQSLLASLSKEQGGAFSGTELNLVERRVAAMKKAGSGAAFGKDVESLLISRQAETGLAAAQGLKEGVAGGSLASVSQDTMSEMVKLAQNLEQTWKAIDALQKNFYSRLGVPNSRGGK
jgi:hypothetical protein